MNCPNCTILQGDALALLKTLPAEHVQCVVTSPPYWGLRDYGVAGQIGLEPTPAEYLARMVAVFEEVRRVLRADGTCWVNMGDCYAGSGRGGNPTHESSTLQGSLSTQEQSMVKRTRKATEIGGSDRDAAVTNIARKALRAGFHAEQVDAGACGRNWVAPAAGFKQKDLMGMPWRLAFALQQPRYLGRIKDERDRVWLAAMIDAEGCIFIHKRKVGHGNGQGYERKNANFAPGLEVSNCCEAVVKRCMAITGVGSICSQSPDQNNRRRQTIFRWNLRTVECREILREVYPYLVAKQHQARIAVGCPSSGAEAERAHAALICLHSGVACEIDFAQPEPMYGPGWYLRSDVIWAKPNPMPESVTDRPTKSHEYLFLLSKSERYHYDAEAIAEPVTGNAHARGHGVNPKTWKTPDGWDTSKGNGGHGSIHREGREKGATEAVRNFKNGVGWGYADSKPKPRTKQNPSFSAAVHELVSSRNKRTVWTIPTQAFPEAHFATFPEALVEPCIKAGCPAGGLVLDPFSGAGTTGLVAIKLGRRYLGLELNPAYAAMAERRIRNEAGLLLEVPA